MAASNSAPPPTASSSAASSEFNCNLIKQIRSHEVAIAELNNLHPSRAVYQKKGNIFFRTTVQKATPVEQRQLDLANAMLQKLNSP